MTEEQIRKSEREYHHLFYKTHSLYEEGSWISQPAMNVMKAFSYVDSKKDLKILDLGCGVGRHSIKIAEEISKYSSIDCVDILETAIEILRENAIKYNVEHKINGSVKEIEQFKFEKHYDFVIGVSVLEHVKTEAQLDHLLNCFKKYLSGQGVICLIINTQVMEADKQTKEILDPQFELNLDTNETLEKLDRVFREYYLLHKEVKSLKYDIVRSFRDIELTTNAVTYIVQKGNNDL